ncbi:hypothetical protein, partial [Pseudoneobacillus sp. C159]
APRPDAAVIVQRAVCQIEHTWTTSAAGTQRWLLSLHQDAALLGTAGELLFIVEDNVLLGANRRAMEEFALLPAHFGHTAIST